MNKSGFVTRSVLLAAAMSFIGLGANLAYAANQADLTVALKTLPLLTNKIQGSAVVGVVFDPANANSKSDADALKAALDAGSEAPGDVKISGVLVPVADVGSKLSQTKLAFVTRGACTDAVGAAAAAANLLTMTTDLDCVKSGKVILGVISSPSVEIYYSKAAADSAKVSFSSAFTMLVKQL